MSEKQLQMQCVRWFGEKYPNQQDMLFEVNNLALNQKHFSTRLAMGMTVGASDLILWHKGTLIAIELKFFGATHEKKRVKNQLDFGLQIVENYGIFFMINSFEEFQFIVNLVFENSESLKFFSQKNIAKVKELLSTKTKSIIFNEKLI